MRNPIFDLNPTADYPPLLLFDPTHFMMINLAIKSDMAPFIFKRLGYLYDELFKIKQEFFNKERSGLPKSDGKEQLPIPKNPLATLVLGMVG